MAKLKAPCLSLGASGQLGKALVYFGWKGLDCVREYVVPTNPKSADQVAHRAHLTEAVAAVHTAQAEAAQPLGSTDQVAYANLAASKGKIMTWFNQVVKLWVDVKVALKTPVIYRGMRFHDLDVTSINITLWLEEETALDLAAGKYWFGTSRTNLIHSEAATVHAGSDVQIADVDLSAFLTAGIKYFVQFRPDAGDPCIGADSGIYYFTAE